TGCTAAAQQDVHVVANIPVPQISSPQISTISNPQISTPQISTPQIATFSLAPSGGAAVSQTDGADSDSRSAVIPDQVQVTLRAIALKPRAEILASGGTLFNPATVEAKVASASTNVVQGIIEAPG